MKHPTFRSLALVALAALLSGWGSRALADETYDGVKFYEYLTTGTSQWSGQRINTGYYPSGKTIIRAKYAPNTVENQALFCSRKTSSLSASAPCFTYFAVVGGTPRFDYYATQHYGSSGTKPVAGNIYFLEITNGYMTVTNEDGSVFDKGGASAAVDFTSTHKLFLFNTYSHDTSTDTYSNFGNGAQVNFYYLKIYEIEGGEEVLKHEYVPCKTAAGVIAVADKVTETVLYNGASTQTFTVPASTEEATWANEGDDKRVLTVPDDVTYALTADDVTALVNSGRNLVIRGKGTTQGVVALTGFTKDIVIEGGIFSMQAKDCFGPNAGSVTIKKGAAISVDAAVANMMSLKKVYFEGTGPDGKGVIRVTKGTWNVFRNSSWNGPHTEFYMTGDAKIYQYDRLDYITFIDTCGHDLEIVGNNWNIFGTAYITNSSATASHVIDKGTRLYLAQDNSNPLRGSADNVLSLTGSSCYYAKWTVPNGWTIDFQNGTYIDADDWVASGADAALTTCRFSGPVNFSGETRVTVRTNRVATLAGPVSGSGTIKVDGGWLNLNSDNVTYTGRLAVVAKSVHEDSWRAGLGLRKATDLPLEDISLTDADLKLADVYASPLPPLTFTGAGTDTVKGGNLTGTRTDGAGILVTNGAVVEITSPITVTGATEIANGTLRIPAAAPLVGNAGLMGYASCPASMLWWFDKPTTNEIASTYTNFYPHGTDPLKAQSSITEIRNYRFHGYIWNRSTTNETWSFWANFNDRIFAWLDGATVFSNTASYDAAAKRCKTIADITPGPHEIILIFTANSGSSGPQWWSVSDGYCGIAIDKSGRGMTNNVTSYYTPLIDPGDGSLLTVDDSATVSDARWVPSFTNLVFGANGILDCDEHALTVGTLAGFGTVTNAATLTVAEKFVLKVSDAASAPLKVNGTLAFADGAVVDFDSYDEPGAEQRLAIRAGIVVAQATEITGAPTLQPWLKAAGYRIRKQGNTLVLTMTQGLMMIVK